MRVSHLLLGFRKAKNNFLAAHMHFLQFLSPRTFSLLTPHFCVSEVEKSGLQLLGLERQGNAKQQLDRQAKQLSVLVK